MDNSSVEPLVEADSVSKTYQGTNGGVAALRSVSLSLSERETVAVLGPTGCGKSTLLYHLAGLLFPDEGTVFFKGQAVDGPHREIALVLQEYGLFPWKTVRQNVELGLKIRKETTGRKRTVDLLRELGIEDKEMMYPAQLSGGQKQRVALARALILSPRLMLMDEPFAALDTLTRERLQDLLVQLWQSHHFALVLVTHNIQEAVRLGKKIGIMSSRGTFVRWIDNPTAMTGDQRGSESFYAVSRELRIALEEELK